MSGTDDETNAQISTFVACPNCHALNTPGVVVCAACGVNLPRFQRLQEALQERIEEDAADHLQQLSEEEEEALASSVAFGRVQTRQLLKWLLVVSLVLAVIVAAGTAFYAHQLELRRQRLAQDYEAAMACMERGDTLCARDTLVALLRAEPGYRDARAQLNKARYQLAWQLADQGAWSAALSELNRLLKESPNDPRVLAAQDEIYSQWLEDAREKGHWLTVLRIMMQHPTD